MARIRGRDTGPERALAAALAERGCAPERHAHDLPGCPDFVDRTSRVAVFVDGDFWHGWRFDSWRDKLSEKWEEKIDGNRLRDARSRRALRRDGWKVIRLWEHQVERDAASCATRVMTILASASVSASGLRRRERS
jgi:DNA mismatch endonuclease (patch repair protein)